MSTKLDLKSEIVGINCSIKDVKAFPEKSYACSKIVQDSTLQEENVADVMVIVPKLQRRNLEGGNHTNFCKITAFMLYFASKKIPSQVTRFKEKLYTELINWRSLNKEEKLKFRKRASELDYTAKEFDLGNIDPQVKEILKCPYIPIQNESSDGFYLYAAENRSSLVKQKETVTHRQITNILKLIWNSYSKDLRDYYMRKAFQFNKYCLEGVEETEDCFSELVVPKVDAFKENSKTLCISSDIDKQGNDAKCRLSLLTESVQKNTVLKLSSSEIRPKSDENTKFKFTCSRNSSNSLVPTRNDSTNATPFIDSQKIKVSSVDAHHLMNGSAFTSITPEAYKIQNNFACNGISNDCQTTRNEPDFDLLSACSRVTINEPANNFLLTDFQRTKNESAYNLLSSDYQITINEPTSNLLSIDSRVTMIEPGYNLLATDSLANINELSHSLLSRYPRVTMHKSPYTLQSKDSHGTINETAYNSYSIDSQESINDSSFNLLTTYSRETMNDSDFAIKSQNGNVIKKDYDLSIFCNDVTETLDCFSLELLSSKFHSPLEDKEIAFLSAEVAGLINYSEFGAFSDFMIGAVTQLEFEFHSGYINDQIDNMPMDYSYDNARNTVLSSNPIRANVKDCLFYRWEPRTSGLGWHPCSVSSEELSINSQEFKVTLDENSLPISSMAGLLNNNGTNDMVDLTAENLCEGRRGSESEKSSKKSIASFEDCRCFDFAKNVEFDRVNRVVKGFTSYELSSFDYCDKWTYATILPTNDSIEIIITTEKNITGFMFFSSECEKILKERDPLMENQVIKSLTNSMWESLTDTEKKEYEVWASLSNQEGQSSNNKRKRISKLSQKERYPKGYYICLECDLIFDRNNCLLRHAKTVHDRAKPFRCGNCFELFPFGRGLLRHVRAVHKSQLYTCEICFGTFSKKIDYDRHNRLELCITDPILKFPGYLSEVELIIEDSARNPDKDPIHIMSYENECWNSVKSILGPDSAACDENCENSTMGKMTNSVDCPAVANETGMEGNDCEIIEVYSSNSSMEDFEECDDCPANKSFEDLEARDIGSPQSTVEGLQESNDCSVYKSFEDIEVRDICSPECANVGLEERDDCSVNSSIEGLEEGDYGSTNKSFEDTEVRNIYLPESSIEGLEEGTHCSAYKSFEYIEVRDICSPNSSIEGIEEGLDCFSQTFNEDIGTGEDFLANNSIENVEVVEKNLHINSIETTIGKTVTVCSNLSKSLEVNEADITSHEETGIFTHPGLLELYGVNEETPLIENILQDHFMNQNHSCTKKIIKDAEMNKLLSSQKRKQISKASCHNKKRKKTPLKAGTMKEKSTDSFTNDDVSQEMNCDSINEIVHAETEKIFPGNIMEVENFPVVIEDSDSSFNRESACSFGKSEEHENEYLLIGDSLNPGKDTSNMQMLSNSCNIESLQIGNVNQLEILQISEQLGSNSMVAATDCLMPVKCIEQYCTSLSSQVSVALELRSDFEHLDQTDTREQLNSPMCKKYEPRTSARENDNLEDSVTLVQDIHLEHGIGACEKYVTDYIVTEPQSVANKHIYQTDSITGTRAKSPFLAGLEDDNRNDLDILKVAMSNVFDMDDFAFAIDDEQPNFTDIPNS